RGEMTTKDGRQERTHILLIGHGQYQLPTRPQCYEQAPKHRPGIFQMLDNFAANDCISLIVSDSHRLLIAGLPAHCERLWTLPSQVLSHTMGSSLSRDIRGKICRQSNQNPDSNKPSTSYDDRAASGRSKQAAHARSAKVKPLHATLARRALLRLDSM